MSLQSIIPLSSYRALLLKEAVKDIFVLLVQFALLGSISAQPFIQWQKSFGGTNGEEAQIVQQTPDGGYMVVGYTSSLDGDIPLSHGTLDIWVLKLDSSGALQWTKTYGGSLDEQAFTMQQTADGGYIIAGYTNSNDGDASGYHGLRDFWVIKIDSIGTLQWQNTLGGSGLEDAWKIQQTSDGGYIVVGSSDSTDGDVTGNHGSLDYWIVKLDSTGNIQWQRSHGGSDRDLAYAVQQTPDGGYIVVGESTSSDGNVSNPIDNGDYWVLKLNFEGKILWEKSYGGTSYDRANDVALTRDGGYLVFGQAYSNNGDITGNHGLNDYWVIKLNQEGELQWQKALGGSKEEFARVIQLTEDDGCILVGQTQSNNGDVIGNDGGADFWLVKLSESGELQWQKTLGGTKAEVGYYVQQTTDGGYITGGFSWSNDGDVSENKGKNDYWVVKLAPESSSTTEIQPQTLQCYPNPSPKYVYLQIPDLSSSETPLQLQVSISNLLGQKISSQFLTQNGLEPAVLDISTLPNGLYLISATLPSGQVYAGKICKE